MVIVLMGQGQYLNGDPVVHLQPKINPNQQRAMITSKEVCILSPRNILSPMVVVINSSLPQEATLVQDGNKGLVLRCKPLQVVAIIIIMDKEAKQ